MGQEIKKVKGKVVFKHETAEDWQQSNYIPDDGEIILVDNDDKMPIRKGNGELPASVLSQETVCGWWMLGSLPNITGVFNLHFKTYDGTSYNQLTINSTGDGDIYYDSVQVGSWFGFDNTWNRYIYIEQPTKIDPKLNTWFKKSIKLSETTYINDYEKIRTADVEAIRQAYLSKAPCFVIYDNTILTLAQFYDTDERSYSDMCAQCVFVGYTEEKKIVITYIVDGLPNVHHSVDIFPNDEYEWIEGKYILNQWFPYWLPSDIIKNDPYDPRNIVHFPVTMAGIASSIGFDESELAVYIGGEQICHHGHWDDFGCLDKAIVSLDRQKVPKRFADYLNNRCIKYKDGVELTIKNFNDESFANIYIMSQFGGIINYQIDNVKIPLKDFKLGNYVGSGNSDFANSVCQFAGLVNDKYIVVDFESDDLCRITQNIEYNNMINSDINKEYITGDWILPSNAYSWVFETDLYDEEKGDYYYTANVNFKTKDNKKYSSITFYKTLDENIWYDSESVAGMGEWYDAEKSYIVISDIQLVDKRLCNFIQTGRQLTTEPIYLDYNQYSYELQSEIWSILKFKNPCFVMYKGCAIPMVESSTYPDGDPDYANLKTFVFKGEALGLYTHIECIINNDYSIKEWRLISTTPIFNTIPDWNQESSTASDYINNKIPLKNGISKNSMQQTGCTAGVKGFYWISIAAHYPDDGNNNPFDNSQDGYSIKLVTFLNDENGNIKFGTKQSFKISNYWSIHDEISIHNDVKYLNCSKITGFVDDNTIIVDKLPFSPFHLKYEYDITDNAVYVLEKPSDGLVDFGMGAVSFGEDSQALGYQSFAAGWKNKSLGQYSATFGRNNISGYCAFTAGRENSNLADHSLVVGKGNINADDAFASLVVGSANTNNAQRTVVSGAGNNVSISAQWSAIFGRNHEVGGESSLTMGNDNTNNGTNAIVGGYNNNSKSNGAIIGGKNNTSTGGADVILVGNGNTNNGYSQVALFGEGNTSTASHQMIIGKYAGAIDSDVLFAIGNGTDINSPSCAMTVKSDKVNIKGNIQTEKSIIVGSQVPIDERSYINSIVTDTKVWGANHSIIAGTDHNTDACVTNGICAGTNNTPGAEYGPVSYNSLMVGKNNSELLYNGYLNGCNNIIGGNTNQVVENYYYVNPVTQEGVNASGFGENSLVVGTGNAVLCRNSVTFGSGNITTKVNNITGGLQNINNGERSYLNGQESSNSGVNAIVSGYRCHSASNGTLVIGNDNNSSGSNNILGGIHNRINGVQNSIVAGNTNIAKHSHVAIFGEGNTSTAEYQTLVGKYTKSSASTLFAVGNGTSTKPSNAFIVSNDNSVTITGNLIIGSTTLTEARLKSIIEIADNDIAANNY